MVKLHTKTMYNEIHTKKKKEHITSILYNNITNLTTNNAKGCQIGTSRPHGLLYSICDNLHFGIIVNKAIATLMKNRLDDCY